MSEPLFDYAFKVIVGEEGNYTNGSGDPGGETKFGISKRSYPHLNIASLTEDQAKQIYLIDFWQKFACDKLPPLLAIVFFDGLVNQGEYSDSKLLQSLMSTTQDGNIGPVTIGYVNGYVAKYGVVSLVTMYLTSRLKLYLNSSNVAKYGEGWENRLFNVAILAAQYKSTGV